MDSYMKYMVIVKTSTEVASNYGNDGILLADVVYSHDTYIRRESADVIDMFHRRKKYNAKDKDVVELEKLTNFFVDSEMDEIEFENDFIDTMYVNFDPVFAKQYKISFKVLKLG